MLCFNRFKNVIFEITPTEEVGDFEVKAKFMGVQMETFMLHYQVGVHQVELEALRLGGRVLVQVGESSPCVVVSWAALRREALSLASV